jgi:putative inorganic carbon (HCO3(-)) transporter
LLALLVGWAQLYSTIMHFGLQGTVPYALYLTGIAAVLLSIFWRPIIGIYYLIPIIPVQTVRYWMMGLPMGQSVIDIVVLAVIIGLLLKGERILTKSPLDYVLLVYAVYTLASLFWGSFYLHRPLPLSPADPRLAEWKSYMTMPLLFYLVAATVHDFRQIRIIIVLTMLAVLMVDRGLWDTISERDFSNYSEDLRDEGSMGYAGVNGLAAFEAQYVTSLLALAAFESRRTWWVAYIGLVIFSALCLMYTLSRAGYAALLVGWLFIGVLQQRKLLALLGIFLITWTAIVPHAVVQRVSMTYDQQSGELEPSAETRLELWHDAMDVVHSSPVVGTGFNTYAYIGRVRSYTDTHNFYLKVLLETGFLGLFLFLWLLWKLAMLGWKAFRESKAPFVRSLGLGLAGWLACAVVANFLGDRWTYLQVDGYLWIFAGCVCRGLLLEREEAKGHSALEPTGAQQESDLASAPA